MRPSPSPIAFEPVHLIANERGVIPSLNDRALELGFKRGEWIQKQLADSVSQRNWIQALAEIPKDHFSLTLQLHQDQTVAFECYLVEPTAVSTTCTSSPTTPTTSYSACPSVSNPACSSASKLYTTNDSPHSTNHCRTTPRATVLPPSPVDEHFPHVPFPSGSHSTSVENSPVEIPTVKEVHMFGVITKRSSDHSPFADIFTTELVG